MVLRNVSSMIKHLVTLIILLTPSCTNPPSTPSWPMPLLAGKDPKSKPIYGRTVFEDDEITVVEVLGVERHCFKGIERDGSSPSHLILKNDTD